MRRVEVNTVIKAAPAQIIAAFIEPHMLSAWWGVERSLINPQIGGTYLLAWDITEKGFGYVTSGIIQAYQPNHQLDIEQMVHLNPNRPFFGPMSLNIGVEKSGLGSQLQLCQDGYQDGPDWDWYYEIVRNAWPRVLADLKHYLEEEATTA